LLEDLRRMNNTLYPPRGGLSDFFIWPNDFSERVRLNGTLNNIEENIWRILLSH